MQIGQVIMWAGIPQLFIIPFLPWLTKRFDIRVLIGIGVVLFAVSCFMNAGMSHDTGATQLQWSQIIRALGQPLIITPLSSVATSDIAVGSTDSGSASGLFNMTRNLGGSLGIACLSTLLTQREQFHSNRLGEAISLYNPSTRERIDQMTQAFMSKGIDTYTAHDQAIAAISNLVRREAYVMAFNDCFYFIGMGLFLSIFAVFFLRKVTISGGRAAH
jgi:MFS transporter, DHA2 family, multidrug resistance protein